MAAVTDAYADVSTYKASQESLSDSGGTSEIEADLLAVSRYIDKRLGRFFTQDASAVARVYKTKATGKAVFGWAESENPWKAGGLTRILYIDDLVSVTTIKIDEDGDGSFDDETALASTDYDLIPRNAALGPEPEPYTGIELTTFGSKGAWPSNTRVEVNGVWGWPSVPKAIERATVQLTAILRMASPRATERVTTIDVLERTSPQAQSIVTDLLRNYRRIYI